MIHNPPLLPEGEPGFRRMCLRTFEPANDRRDAARRDGRGAREASGVVDGPGGGGTVGGGVGGDESRFTLLLFKHRQQLAHDLARVGLDPGAEAMYGPAVRG